MTNTSNSNLQWEVAGSKKLLKKATNESIEGNHQSSKKPNGKVATKEQALKMPKLETLPPLKPDSTIYEYIQMNEEDDDFYENSSRSKSSKNQPTNRSQSDNSDSQQSNSASTSPKQTNQQRKKTPTQEPINLLSASLLTTQKKKSTTPSSPGKRPEVELANAISKLNVDDFQKKYTQLENLPQYNLELIVKQLASELNLALNDIPEFDFNSNHENESTFYPASKLDKKLEKFFNGLITKLKRPDVESVFEYCFRSLFGENQKIHSYHGYKIFIQLLIKLASNVVFNNLPKYVEIMNANRHRHQRIFFALWTFAQIGYLNLNIGIRVWFDGMLPFFSTKNCTNYVATYLDALFRHHKLDSKSAASKLKNQSLIKLEEYLSFYDLVNDKSYVFSKDVSQKFKSSFQRIRDIFVEDFDHDGNKYFEYLLSNLPVEKTERQNEFLELLAKILFKNKSALLIWRKVYAKNLPASLLLLEHLANKYNKSLKSLKEMGETLHLFEQQTTQQLINLTTTTTASTSNKENSAKHYYANRKAHKTSASSIELERVKHFNKLVKQLIRQHFQRISVFSMVLRTLFLVTIATGLFFYWDVKQNKSTYVNSLEKELERYGLLESTLKLIDTVQKFLLNVQSLINHYGPIYYKKTADVVVPYMKTFYQVSLEYGKVAWNKSEPFINSAIVYSYQTKDYIVENFPVFIKNLESVLQLAINYATTLLNFFMHYAKIVVDYVGIQLLGWKGGELEQIFFDGFKYLLENITRFIQWLNTNLNNE